MIMIIVFFKIDYVDFKNYFKVTHFTDRSIKATTYEFIIR